MLDQITNGESGLSVRDKLNTSLAQTSTLKAQTFDIPGSPVATGFYDPYAASDFGDHARNPAMPWYQQERCTGTYRGVAANETAGRALPGAVDGDCYWNSTDLKLYELGVGSGQTEKTRAGSQEMPSLSIVAHLNQVALLDANTGDMWRVRTVTEDISSVAMIEGKLIIGTDGGVIIDDFSAGDIDNDPTYTTSTSPAIVNNTVNAVAATVLPDAPIDTATGLRVPTVFAHTYGGISQIGWDGNGNTDAVWDIAATTGQTAILKGAVCDGVLTVANSDNYGYLFNVPITADEVNGYLTQAASFVRRIRHDDVLPYVGGASTPITALENSILGNANGVSWFKENPASPANGMVAYTAHNYATGFMVGDCALAAMCEQGAGSVTGTLPDRSVNGNDLNVVGTLTQDADGWISGFSATEYLEQPYNSDLDFGTGDFCVMGWLSDTESSATDYLLDRIFGGLYFRATLLGENLRFNISGAYCDTINAARGDGSNRLITLVRKDGVGYIYLNDELDNSASMPADVGGGGVAALRFGASAGGGNALNTGKLKGWRIGATAPTPEQIAWIYNVERHWFGNDVTLPGTTSAILDLDYDEITGLHHVLTSEYHSVWKMGVMVDSAANTGSWTHVSAHDGRVTLT